VFERTRLSFVLTRVAACLLDVSFVLAFSSNETQRNNTNWRFVTDFMINVAYSINVGEQMTHVGAVSTGMFRDVNEVREE